jgi:SAM-dependent methyltransferase
MSPDISGTPLEIERMQSMSATIIQKKVMYVCPKCRGPLQSVDHSLICQACGRTYPIAGGIPDFLQEDILVRQDPSYRSIKKMEFLAPVYEGQIWHSFILKVLAGADTSSLQGIAQFVAETLRGITGSVLDVACGPATYGRRMATPARSVYGIDFSMGTLRQGMANIRRDGNVNVYLSRARIPELPFEDSVFDGAICCGSLHLFPDTALALREIARTMKAGAPLAVTTFAAQNAGALQWINRRRQIRIFRLPDLKHLMMEAGFESFDPVLDGSFLTFRTRKAMAAIGAI